MGLSSLSHIDNADQHQDDLLEAAYDRYRMRTGSALLGEVGAPSVQVGGGGEPTKVPQATSPSSSGPPVIDQSTPTDLSKDRGSRFDRPPPVLRPQAEEGRRFTVQERQELSKAAPTAAATFRDEIEKMSEEQKKKDRVTAAMTSEGRIAVERERLVVEERRRQWGGGSSALVTAAATGADGEIFTQLPTHIASPLTPPNTPVELDGHKEDAKKDDLPVFTFVDEGPAEEVDLKQYRRKPLLRRIRVDIGNNRFYEVRTKEWSDPRGRRSSFGGGGGGSGQQDTPTTGRYQVAIVGRKYVAPDGTEKEFSIEIPPSSFDLLIDAMNESRGIGPAARKQPRKAVDYNEEVRKQNEYNEGVFNSSFVFDDSKY
jgi:hypothetical protein